MTYRVTFTDLQGCTSSFLLSCLSFQEAKRKAREWGRAYRPGWTIEIEERNHFGAWIGQVDWATV